MPMSRTKPIPLSDTQLVILSKASQRDDRRIVQPSHLRGAVFSQLIVRLAAGGLITGRILPGDASGHDYIVSDAGLLALGIEPAPADNSVPLAPSKIIDEPVTTSPAINATASSQIGELKLPRIGSKLSLVIGLLVRPAGASITELMAQTGWLAHTTRAALTGLRKQGIAIGRGKTPEGETRYYGRGIAGAAQAGSPPCQSPTEAETVVGISVEAGA